MNESSLRWTHYYYAKMSPNVERLKPIRKERNVQEFNDGSYTTEITCVTRSRSRRTLEMSVVVDSTSFWKSECLSSNEASGLPRFYSRKDRYVAIAGSIGYSSTNGSCWILSDDFAITFKPKPD
jgi:hypothetical protein